MSDYTKLIDEKPWNVDGRSDPKEPVVYDHLRKLAEGVFSQQSVENESLPAGYTYFAQFLNHDLTFALPTPSGTRNARTARLDLDSLYGRGPAEDPHLYDLRDPARLAVGRNDNGELDLPRSADRSAWRGSIRDNHASQWRHALIGDPRNDENVLIAQMHLAMILLHNHFVDTSLGMPDRMQAYAHARRRTTWHYQYVVVNDLLRRLCAKDIWEERFTPSLWSRVRCFPRRDSVYIPLEFSLAALRVGHSMIRERYVLADRLTEPETTHPQHFPIFDSGTPSAGLVGRRSLPRNWSLQWDRFVECDGSPPPQKAMRFDEFLVGPLQSLPEMEPGAERSLAMRTLQAGAREGLASGGTVARALGEAVVGDGDAPLWLYLLVESREQTGGRRFGRCAARLTAETLHALLLADPECYLRVNPGWTPAQEAASSASEGFDLRDLLELAGMPMTAAALP
jgi:hypothetical protein